ncbi:hypothetical protein G7Z17_g1390 [Cylindrodendrum hubeiense]|uniref:Uncharacterized protein n=1 Tax=Cylindrodendrum hubeiense TaxID=595255 RepID=A0A9P5HJF4_9HYPO|nr:hypothetical protein G7Z17_g1390 [Cylindrodendrum hubeiense]
MPRARGQRSQPNSQLTMIEAPKLKRSLFILGQRPVAFASKHPTACHMHKPKTQYDEDPSAAGVFVPLILEDDGDFVGWPRPTLPAARYDPSSAGTQSPTVTVAIQPMLNGMGMKQLNFCIRRAPPLSPSQSSMT